MKKILNYNAYKCLEYTPLVLLMDGWVIIPLTMGFTVFLEPNLETEDHIY
jgi:hypothetical protein